MAAAAAPVVAGRELPVGERLKITETFRSLQGEALAVGWPTFFIRLTGCPLRCVYCDTEYAFHGGQWQSIDALVDAARSAGVHHVCVTGGEPLAQPNCLKLLARLCDAGFDVSLETSGALDIGGVDARVQRIVDVKTPSSGEVMRNRWENIPLLTPRDAVKFVIADRADFDWSRERVLQHELTGRCTVLFSPVQGRLAAGTLADWILGERLQVRFQLQLHKVLWGDVAGR